MTRNGIIAATRILHGEQVTQTNSIQFASNLKISAPSVCGYGLNGLRWSRLGWVVASQGTSGDWLEPTRNALRCSLSLLLCFSFLSIPASPQLPSSNSQRNSSQEQKAARASSKKRKITPKQERKKNIQIKNSCCSIESNSSFSLCFLFSFLRVGKFSCFRKCSTESWWSNLCPFQHNPSVPPCFIPHHHIPS